MPGLLQAPSEGPLYGVKFASALLAEFVGVMLFSLFGSVVPSGNAQQTTGSGGNTGVNGATPPANFAPWGNGLTLAALVYITANISGGHLNPAVTLAALVSRHISILRGFAYIICQIAGACFGSLLVAGLVPQAYVGMGNSGIGCFTAAGGINRGQLFGWELFSTFILVSTVFAVAIGKPNFGIAGPFIVGVALWAMALCSGQYTGAALNPARVLGPAAVFHCHWDLVWIYLLAHIAAALLAGLVAWPLYGDALDLVYQGSSSDGGGKDEEEKPKHKQSNGEKKHDRHSSSEHAMANPMHHRAPQNELLDSQQVLVQETPRGMTMV